MGEDGGAGWGDGDGERRSFQMKEEEVGRQ